MTDRSGLGQLDLQQALFGVRLSDLYTRERLLFSMRFDELSGEQAGALIDLNKAMAGCEAAPPVPWRADAAVEDAATRAIAQLTEQLSETRADDVARLRHLTSRAQAFSVLHQFEDALSDLSEVLAADQFHPRALLLKATIAFYQGKLSDAASAVKRVSGKEASAAAVLLAEILLASGELEKPAEIYKRIITMSSADDRSFERARLLRSYSGLRKPEQVNTLQMIITTREREAPLMVLAISEHELLFGDQERATALAEQAFESASGNDRLWLAWQAGRCLYMTGNPLGSSDWYQTVAPEETDSLAHREYVHALFKAQLLAAAHRRARAIRALHGDVIIGITEIEANCLLQSNNPAAARDLLEALSQKHPYLDNHF